MLGNHRTLGGGKNGTKHQPTVILARKVVAKGPEKKGTTKAQGQKEFSGLG